MLGRNNVLRLFFILLTSMRKASKFGFEFFDKLGILDLLHDLGASRSTDDRLGILRETRELG